MRSTILGVALFTFTATGVALYPMYHSAATTTEVTPRLAAETARVEVVFVLDTTGSMSDMIGAAKEKIWSIASSLASAQQAPQIRMGLVAFRDRGDAYVTRVYDLSDDLDSTYAALMDFRAEGGGDEPESVNQALHDAVHAVSWSQTPGTYRAIFLVGDSPPHMDYANDVKYGEILRQAKGRGIVVNTVQCGSNVHTTTTWKRIAQLGNGRYFPVDQAGSAVTITTPFDDTLAELSRKLDETRLYYGSEEIRAKKQAKVAATEKLHQSASVASRARRAAFNASPSGKTNLFGEGELVDDISSGRVGLSEIDGNELPLPMRSMTPAEQQAVIAETAERRDELARRIEALSAQRADYLAREVDRTGGAAESLDAKIYGAVREQAGRVGLDYDAPAPAY